MKWFALLLAVPFLLLSAGLLKNRPPLLSPPGPTERLKTYLTTNVAETRLDHPFPELRPPLVSASPDQALELVRKAMQALGWKEIRAADGEVRGIVVSALFRFRDEVSVRAEAQEKGSLIQARSASRVGKGDLAANAAHLRALFAEIERLSAPGE